MIQNNEQMQKLMKDNMDALTGNVSTITKSAQNIALEVADYSKKNFEESAQVLEKTMGAKSLGQLIEVQSNYAKGVYDSYVSQMNKLGGLYMEFAKDVYQPIEDAFAKFSK